MVFSILLFTGNALLWVFVFLHLKKKLSPKGIVQEARKELEALLLQLNGASDRNIRLIQEQIAQLKHASAEAEQLCGRVEERLAMLYGEMEKASSVKAVEDRLYPAARQQEKGAGIRIQQELPVSSAAESGAGEEMAPEPKVILQEETLNKSYSPLDSYMKEQLRFSVGGEDVSRGAEPDIPAAREPLPKPSVPEFIQAETPIEIQKPFRQQVMEMRVLGYSIEEIAHETGRSTQEVKIAIEIS